MTIKARASIADLYAVTQKAEIINGEIVRFMPTGRAPGYAADEIFASLRQYAKRHKTGIAAGDNKGFHVSLPNRESFSPDAAYYVGSNSGMRFFEGAPVFAVEVRSENDYGVTAEAQIAAKRRDYFAAGTLVVWDVDLLGKDVVKSYRASAPEVPHIFRRGETANAEPAVPGWTIAVDDIFEEEAAE